MRSAKTPPKSTLADRSAAWHVDCFASGAACSDASPMGSLLHNVCRAARSLVRTPRFTAAVVATLAVGIGINSAVFSAIDVVLLKPLSFPDGDRLVHLSQSIGEAEETPIAPGRLEDWRELTSTFDAMTGYYVEDVSDTTAAFPERVRRAWVAPGFIETFGVPPVLGRGFTPDEHRVGGPQTVVISARYWRLRFGEAPDVIGKTIRLDDESFQVVGVMPESFLFPDRSADLWLPVAIDRAPALTRTSTWYVGIARMSRDVTIEQARADLARAQARLAEQYPETDTDIAAIVEPLKDRIVGDAGGSLWMLYGAVSVLLLIACANISALLLSRVAQRQHEIGIRYALGAARSAVARELLTESAVLAFAGAAAGVVVAAAATAAFRAAAIGLPRIDELSIDARLAAYAALAATGVALLCGILPALRGSRPVVDLARTGRAQLSSGHRVQWLLVGTQVALSITLAIAATTLLRSFAELSRVDPGFDAENVITFRISADFGETTDIDRVVQRINTSLDEIGALPGIESIAVTNTLPGVPGGWVDEYAPLHGADGNDPIPALAVYVSPSYFDTMRIPLVAGEMCRRAPDASFYREQVPVEVVVNRSFAERYFSGRSVIGAELRESTFGSIRRVVGVVDNARENGIHAPAAPTIYTCFGAPNPMPWFLARIDGDASAIVGAIRQKVREIEPLRSVYDVAPLDDLIGGVYAEERLRTYLVASFAAAALGLVCLGIYATLSYVVSVTKREIGLRVALGATRTKVVSRLMSKALSVVAVASAAGLVLSLALTGTLSGMVYAVSASDPVTFAAVIVVVCAFAAAAAWRPAARAARLEPMLALRDE